MRSKVCSDIPSTDRSLSLQLERLKYPQFNASRVLAAFSQRFDEGVKKVFSVSNSNTSQYVKFLSPKDNDRRCGIKAGMLRLAG